MGVNICVVNDEMEDHPDWDYGRFAGDKEVDSILSSVGRKTKMVGHEIDCMYLSRPEHVIDFRMALSKHFDYNEDRWELMCDLLEDPEWWLYFSY